VVKEPVLATSPQWISVASDNEHKQQQQQGCSDVFDRLDVVKPHAENTMFN